MTGVSRETRQRLNVFVSEFHRWNARHNLTSKADDVAVIERHVSDSIQLANFAPAVCDWVDVGSGGGFPGAILAATFADDPDRSVTLIESNAKKCAFLRHVCLAMNAPVTVLNERVERSVVSRDAPTIVSARAVASLTRLCKLLQPWLQGGTTGLFPKGRAYEDELDEARGSWEFDCRPHRSCTASDSVILEIANVRPKTAAIVGS